MFFLNLVNEQDEFLVETLYIKYRFLLYSQAYKILQDKYLSEDALQQTFIRLINNIHKTIGKSESQIRNFLVIICENVAKDIYKQCLSLNKKCAEMEEISNAELTIDTGEDPESIVINRETVNYLKEAIKQLDPIYRDVILLKHAYQCSSTEICELLHISSETLKKRMYRARKKLLEALTKETNYEMSREK